MVADGFEGTKVFAIILHYIPISNQINQFALVHNSITKLMSISI